MYDDASIPAPLVVVLRQAHQGLQERLRRIAPELADALVPWMEARAGRGMPAEAYFTHPAAFPLVALPWWLEESLGVGVDLVLQADLMHSSMAGYYLIRIIDDVMDRSEHAAVHLLPAVAVLHAEFQARYAARFPAADRFWTTFFAAWAETHQAAMIDSRLGDIDRDTFRRICGRKVAAALIPMIAAARHHGREAPPDPWPELFAELCGWHQLRNDLFDWQRDHAAGIRTWFLSEAERRRRPDESVTSWVAREGFERGHDWLVSGLAQLRRLAGETGSPGAVAYFTARAADLERLAAEVRPALPALRALGLLDGRQRGAAGRS